MLRIWRVPMLVLACFALGLSSCQAAASSLDIEVILEPMHTGVPVPVSVSIADWPSSQDVSPRGWILEERPSGRPVPWQLNKTDASLEFIVEVPISSRRVRKLFKLRRGRQPETGSVHIEHTANKDLKFVDGEQPVLVYNYRTVLPEGVPEKWRRSCYVHPIYGPNGELLTDDFPADHFHHRGLSWMWPQVKVGDKAYDLWTIRGIRQRFVKLLSCEGGQVSATLRLANVWYTDDGRKVMNETVTIKAFRAGTKGRIVDVELMLAPVGEAVTLGSSARGYGGLNFRFAPREETALTTSGGALEKDVDRERFLWSDLSAKFGASSEFSGVAIFDHPGNPSHPTGWTNRFYGILDPSFTGIESVTIRPEEPLKVQYRLWIHEGNALTGCVGRAYEAYLHPPNVRVVTNSKGD